MVDEKMSFCSCFSGHRDLPADRQREIKRVLENVIDKLIEGGCNRFISGGALDGMLFEMQNGELKMKTGDFECTLTEDDSPALYALFGGFAIEPSEFVGVTEDTDGVLCASFGGKYKYTLMTDSETKSPLEINVRADGGEYKIKFK